MRQRREAGGGGVSSQFSLSVTGEQGWYDM